jgi:hypothetical protein
MEKKFCEAGVSIIDSPEGTVGSMRSSAEREASPA